MEKVRWGVIGSGGIAKRRTIPQGIVPALNAVLKAVYDVEDKVNREVADFFGAEPCGSVEELLAREIDAVYIATPVYLHVEQILASIAAGKHVLCEKPLGMNAREARHAAGAAAQARLRLGAAFMMRFHAQHQAALALIREGRLGRPVFARAQLSCWYPRIAGAWRQDPERGGGGSLIDLGGHTIDLLEMFFGPVRTVSCFTANLVQNYHSEDAALAALEFTNGALGVIDAFFSIPDEASDNVLELYGSRGSILAKGTIGQGSQGQMIARLREEPGRYEAQQDRSGKAAEIVIEPPAVNPYRAEIEDFSEAILDGRPISASADAGVRSARILDACYESAQSGKTVDIG